MLGGDGLGIPPQGPADSWHRTPGSKMGNKPATSSWPPGMFVFLCLVFNNNQLVSEREQTIENVI